MKIKLQLLFLLSKSLYFCVILYLLPITAQLNKPSCIYGEPIMECKFIPSWIKKKASMPHVYSEDSLNSNTGSHRHPKNSSTRNWQEITWDPITEIKQEINRILYNSLHKFSNIIGSLWQESFKEITQHNKQTIFDAFIKSHENFNRKVYNITFNKLLEKNPKDRKVNGISFIESGLFLQLMLIALADEMSPARKAEIEQQMGLQLSKSNTVKVLKKIISRFPVSNNDLKFFWSNRLVLGPGSDVSSKFREGAASVLKLHVNRLNGTESTEEIVKILNAMVENDTAGAIRNSFHEEDVSGGVVGMLLTTLYIRPRWRSFPTLLNGSRPFRDVDDAPQRTIRMIRINDIMRYADITEWNVQALEIFYATKGLSLLMLVPRDRSIRNLSARVASTNISDILQRMRSARVAALLPLYTLRMTLLFPNKLEALMIGNLHRGTMFAAYDGFCCRITNKKLLKEVTDMGIHLFNHTAETEGKSLKLSQAVQRLMFYAEPGRHAFKDDGIQWDKAPEFEIVVDSPYIFFVRWNNFTLMEGNFVL